MRNTTICINHREDSRVHWTIANIKRTCDPLPEIIVIDDGNTLGDIDGVTVIKHKKPMGTSYCRHVGVTAASKVRVITMDSHIDFSDGWLEKFEEALDRNNDVVVCGKCRNVDANGREVGYHAGANISFFDEPSNPVAGKWRSGLKSVGSIQCLMGACYGISKIWYEQIGEPWKFGLGWGGDEESVSIATRLMLGTVVCLDVDIIHIYQPTPTYEVKASDCERVLYNKARLLEMLPISATRKRHAMNMLIGESPHRNKINAMMRETGIREYGKWLKENARVKFKQIEGESMKKEVAKKTRKKETKPRVQNKIVVDKGNPCPKCGNPYDHRVQNTYPNGRRRVLCGAKNGSGCGMPFILRREL